MFRSLIGLMVMGLVGAYIWLPYDEHMDAVVGISIYRQPLCTGVFIKDSTILTSANPLEGLWRKHGKHLRVTQVIYSYDRNLTYRVRRVGFNQANRYGEWVTMGHRNSPHSPIHDLMIIRLRESRMKVNYKKKTWHMRRRFFTPMATKFSYFSTDDVFYFAGFGFVDEEHIKYSNMLDIEYLSVSTQADCDEWIPREWGRFLCFYDFNNLAGVPSGAPLYHGNFIPGLSPVYGIASFSLTKNKETILVFTDLRAYTHKLHSSKWTAYDLEWKKPNLPYITDLDPIIPDSVKPGTYEPPPWL